MARKKSGRKSRSRLPRDMVPEFYGSTLGMTCQVSTVADRQQQLKAAFTDWFQAGAKAMALALGHDSEYTRHTPGQIWRMVRPKRKRGRAGRE